MPEESLPDTAVVQGDVGETIPVEQKDEQVRGEELQLDDELKQRVIARQEEKVKGELSAPATQENEDKEELTDSELVATQQQQQERRKRTRKNATSLTSKQKEQQPNLYHLSKQLENHTRQLSRIGTIVEQLPRYLKNVDAQSRMIKQINSSINQLQKQIVRIQKSVQKKDK